jgi:hypothetical protein
MGQFWQHFTTSRAFGRPLWWSVKTSWGWRHGPNAHMLAARAAYIKATNRD